MYNFWVKELDCTSCGHTVPLFKDYRVAAGRYENDDKYNVLCPDCGAVTLVDDWQAEESTCGACFAKFDASEGRVSGGDYSCPECGQRESTLEAIQQQGGHSNRLYAVEYYCSDCEKRGHDRAEYKGYKRAEIPDRRLFRQAREEWANRTDLHDYVPSEDIPLGIKTDSSKFEGSIGG
jgi:adenine-specific DNA methylase